MKRTRFAVRVTMLVVLACSWRVAARADKSDKGSPPPPITKKIPPEPDGFTLGGDPKLGLKVYKTYCTKCHGESGQGTGLLGKTLNPRPRDFTDPGMLARKDWELYLAVKEGGKPFGFSEKMTPWKDTLKDKEIRNVVSYVRTFAKPPAK